MPPTRELSEIVELAKKMFHSSNSEKLRSFVISPDMVRAKLIKLKMNKAPGVDLIGTRMLVELADVAELFSKSYI